MACPYVALPVQTVPCYGESTSARFHPRSHRNRSGGSILAAKNGSVSGRDRHPAGSSDRPRFVTLGERLGLIGFSEFEWTKSDISSAFSTAVILSNGRSVDPVGELGRSLEQLRRLTGPEIGIRGYILLPNIASTEFLECGLFRCIPSEIAVCADQIREEELLTRSCTLDQVSPELLSSVRSRLYPETEFRLPKLATVKGRAERQTIRLQLDTSQEAVARSMRCGITALAGVAGSGKSLVIAARARYLAQTHEDWRVHVVCYNNSLVKYLSSLVGDEMGDVSVSTFHSWGPQASGLATIRARR